MRCCPSITSNVPSFFFAQYMTLSGNPRITVRITASRSFSSKAYFTAAFTEATGSTPLEWRLAKLRGKPV